MELAIFPKKLSNSADRVPTLGLFWQAPRVEGHVIGAYITLLQKDHIL